MAGADALAADLAERGKDVERVSCLAQCDRAPATLDEDLELLTYEGKSYGVTADDPNLPMNLAGSQDTSYSAFQKCKSMKAERVIGEIEAAGLQGRGGAGFPAHFKWKSMIAQQERERVHHL